MLVAMVLALAGAEVAVRILRPGYTPYREHEKWRHDFDRYEANVVDTIAMPHGDLVALAPSLGPQIAEPRSVEFRTDSAGQRNDADYRGQALVLVGDSFVVGNGNTQAHMLGEVLRSEHALDTYSIAYPGDPPRYFRRARDFLAQHPEARFLFFYFEGNDFQPPGGSGAATEGPNAYDRFRSQVRKDLFPGLHYPILAFNLSRTLEQRLLHADRPSSVTVRAIGGRPVGFLDEQVRIAESPEVRLEMSFAPPRVVGSTAAAFFIPTTHRVYDAWIEDGVTLPEPAPAFEALRAFYANHAVPVIDLTPALRRRAEELLPQGEFVFWRDDTHWNQHGIRAAAEEVARWAGSGR